MSALKICRICLRTGAKMYKFDRFQLLYFYEQVMSLKVNEKDGLPQYFCYECAALLQKFHEFKEKCFRGLIALKKILWKGQISYKTIDNMDRIAIKLMSPLDVLTVSKRVKTVSTIEKQEIDDIKDEDDTDYRDDPAFTDSDDEVIIKCKLKRKKSTTPDHEIKEVTKDKKTKHKTVVCDGSDEDEPIKPQKSKNKRRKSLFEKDKDKPRDRQAKRKKKSFYESDLEDDFSTECKVKSRESSVSGFDDNTEPAIFVEEKPMHSDTELDITFEDGTKPSGSTTVFVDEKKVLEPEKETEEEPVKEAKTKSTRGPKKAKWNAKNKVLESGNWKKYSLSEEEALEQFRAKATDPKYIAAPFKCADCFKGFSKEEILKRHRRLHDAAIGNFECRFCRMRFKIDCRLRKHMRAHYTKYECLRCNLICPIELTALLHEELHNGVVKKCEQCNEEFRHRSTYYTHMRTHRSEHVCTLCGASFVSPAGLHQHKKKKHFDNTAEAPPDDEKQTYCKKCDIRFETRAAYTEHLFHSAMHTEGMEDEIRDESCALRKVIGKMSKAKIANELRKRQSEDQPLPRLKLNTRKGRRIFKKPTDCYQCGKHFDTQDACLRHHREEHPRTSFYPPSDRQICEICGASLSRSTVAMHLNMHTRETLYSCDVCGRTFHSKGGLKRHMVTHTGEKRYACRLCEKRFTQSGSLSLHYRTFHLKQPYPPRNRRKEIEKPSADAANFLGFYGKEEY